MNNLVTAADVKQHTTVGANADDKKLAQAVPDAQQDRLRPLLGSDLLAALLAFVVDYPAPPAANQPGVPAAQAQTAYATSVAAWRTANDADPLLALLDEVVPCLAQWVLVEAWPDLLVHIDASGVNLKTGKSEGTTSADVATLATVHAAHRERAVRRSERLVNWLESKKTDYPAYVSTRPRPTAHRPSDCYGGISV